MSEMDIDQKIFNCFFYKVKSLQPHKEDIKIGKYTFAFKYINIWIKYGEKIIDEIMVDRLGSKASPEYLENCSIEFFVYGLFDNYINGSLYKDNNNYKMKIDYEVPKKSIEEIFNIIENNIRGDKKWMKIIKL